LDHLPVPTICKSFLDFLLGPRWISGFGGRDERDDGFSGAVGGVVDDLGSQEITVQDGGQSGKRRIITHKKAQKEQKNKLRR